MFLIFFLSNRKKKYLKSHRTAEWKNVIFLTTHPLNIANSWMKIECTICFHVEETTNYKDFTFSFDQQKYWKQMMLLYWKVLVTFCPVF